MNTITRFFLLRQGSLQMATLILVTLLQRTPVLRLFLSAEPILEGINPGHVLKSTAFLAVTLGAIDSLAGATTMTASPVSPAAATVGTSFSAAFAVTGAPSTTKSYTISNLPPGLDVTGSTTSGTKLLLNASTGTITGTPTTAGTYAVVITAYENTNAGGHSTGFSYTIVVSGTTVSAPTITTQPSSVSVNAGSSATFTVVASGSGTLSYQWYKDSTAISGATSASYTISSAATSNAGSYTVTVTNSGGSVTSSAATLTVLVAPTITTQPSSVSVNAGSSATFTVVASGSGTLSYQWYKDSTAISGATSASYTISSATTSNAGSYTVTVTNTVGSVTSSAATLTVTSVTAPSITTNPTSLTKVAGSSASFTVAASGTSPLSYQWYKNGTAISGATAATYTISSIASSDAADYYAIVTNSAGAATSVFGRLVVGTSTTGNLTNASIRGVATGSSSPLIVGFVSTGTRQLLVRGIGPTLGTLGLASGTYITDSYMRVYDSAGTLLTYNDNWGDTQAAALTTAFNSVGAFSLATGSLDAAAIITTDGIRTVHVFDKNNVSGIALVEVYDYDSSGNSNHLVNLSARNDVGTGDNVLIAGFVIGGNAPKKLLLRGVGPELNVRWGITGYLADPVITLHTSVSWTGTSVDYVFASNDDWGSDATNVATAEANSGAFTLTSGSKDAAMVVTLPAGVYTVILSGKNSTTGNAMVELYDLGN